MDRRSFFTSLGAAAAVPLVGCTGRDEPARAGASVAAQLIEMRTFPIPEGVEVALPFTPLRRKR
ncbi:MAG: hypothetical protein H0V17_07920 [Deltaproteobacteria bacterium]|nr:hypothetical protein [Deltaproteobacteria bacterium]